MKATNQSLYQLEVFITYKSQLLCDEEESADCQGNRTLNSGHGIKPFLVSFATCPFPNTMQTHLVNPIFINILRLGNNLLTFVEKDNKSNTSQKKT